MSRQTSHIIVFAHKARKKLYDCLICDKSIEKNELYVILNYPFALNAGYVFHAECYISDHPDGVVIGYHKSRWNWRCKTIHSITELQNAINGTNGD